MLHFLVARMGKYNIEMVRGVERMGSIKGKERIERVRGVEEVIREIG